VIRVSMWPDPNFVHTEKSNKHEMGYQLDEEHIVAQLRTIISAGYETISATLAVGFPHTSLVARLTNSSP
jgi:hypothetical protein